MERYRTSSGGEGQLAALTGRANQIGNGRVLSCSVLILFILAPLIGMPKADDTANRQRSEMLVTTDWLASHSRDSDLVVLCVAADERFYTDEHIPGARLLRLSEILTERNGIPNQLPSASRLIRAFENAGVSNNSRIILYGERSGIFAARAYFTLDYLGLAEHAALLDGGIEKWRAERRPQSTQTPQVAPTSVQVRLHPEIVVDTPQMAELAHAMSGPNKVVLLDARPTPEYTGEKLSEDVTQAGHIPDAHGLYWHNLLRPGDTPELLPAPELRKMFEDAGALSGKEIVTYCRTGMQSSFDYFVARYLGYSTRMYPGSFYEWSRSGRSVESNAMAH